MANTLGSGRLSPYGHAGRDATTLFAPGAALPTMAANSMPGHGLVPLGIHTSLQEDSRARYSKIRC